MKSEKLFPFELPIKSVDDLPAFYQDYILRVSGESDIHNVKVDDANGLFQMIQDGADVTFSYDGVSDAK